MRGKKRVTVIDVAKDAGVSAQTVSRVVRGHGNVAETTRKQVQEAIDRLGYRPNRLARRLVQGRSRTIGIVSYGLALHGPAQTLAGIMHEAARQEYSILPQILQNPQLAHVEPLLNRLDEFNVDGIIWAVPEIDKNRVGLGRLVKRYNVPFIFMTGQPRTGWAIANIDNRAGGRLAARHLIERGYRHLGMIAGPTTWWEARERLAGWREAVEEGGFSADSDHICSGDWSAASGERCLHHLLDQHPHIDAIFACNDSMAVGAIKAARERGRRIPDDLAIVGFDDLPESAYFEPALTTIRQPFDVLGSRAVAELERMVNAPESAPVPIAIPPQLVVRNSS